MNEFTTLTLRILGLYEMVAQVLSGILIWTSVENYNIHNPDWDPITRYLKAYCKVYGIFIILIRGFSGNPWKRAGSQTESLKIFVSTRKHTIKLIIYSVYKTYHRLHFLNPKQIHWSTKATLVSCTLQLIQLIPLLVRCPFYTLYFNIF